MEGSDLLIQCDNIVLRKIANKFYLINIKDNYTGDICKLYEINEIGNFIWNLLDNPITLVNIVDKLFKVIVPSTDYSIVYNDVDHFINVLIDLKFIRSYSG